MRVAAFDIGTNTVLMLVAEARVDGPRAGESGAETGPFELVAVLERARITRLGEGVDRTRELAPAAVERTLGALRDFSEEARSLGVDRIVTVGTSAMRDARGGEAFVDEAERILGTRPQVISGEREAELTFHGALSGLPLSGALAVFDIGGGSTEIVVGSTRATARSAVSLDVGSVRLTERIVRSDPPSADEMSAIATVVDTALANAPRPAPGTPLVGIAGTVTTLAAIALGIVPYDGARIHGSRMTLAQIDEVLDRLARLPVAERRALPGLEPKRADVIVAGAIIARQLVLWTGATEILVSDRGVRWGVALEALTAGC